MCHEDGMVFDDGVTSCIADDHFLMTTTSGGAAGVLRWLEVWHQTEWPELEVYFTSVTDHWATMTISGPNSRNVLKQLVGGEDVSEEAMPFMSWKPMMVAGVPARVFRISFTGELSFEINVNADFGLYVWEQVMAAGKPYNITPYGTETMHILRAEKGFIIVGQDTDGSVTPQDLNMAGSPASRKPTALSGGAPGRGKIPHAVSQTAGWAEMHRAEQGDPRRLRRWTIPITQSRCLWLAM